MDVIEKYIPHPDRFIRDYLESAPHALSLFDYGISEEESRRRLKELRERESSFSKDALYQHLYTYNKKFLFHSKALEELEKLKRPDAVMVVGGQQAGLLSGPAYTISKAITLIKEAEEQERRLGVPVIPLFWIAGEDHDWNEVNHIFLPGNCDADAQKYTYRGSTTPGAPVSEQMIQEDAFVEWWHQLAASLPETSHTKELFEQLHELVARAFSITDFFGEVMRWLFRDTGLIMLDAHHSSLRTIEKEIFEGFIDDIHSVQGAVKTGMETRRKKGYSVPEGISQESAHFFYQVQGKRLLMYEKEQGNFTDKHEDVTFTKKKIRQALHESPHLFSANVVTRPLVQEMLLPVLTFIGGPGEINYWSVLKPLFHQFGVKVPPVKTRLECTFIPRRVQYILQKENLTIDDCFHNEMPKYIEWIKRQAKEVDGQGMAEEILAELAPQHESMRKALESVAPSERSYGDKNWQIIKRDLLQFAKKIDSMQEKKESQRIKRIKEAECYVRPLGKPQERIYNIFLFVNEYGLDLTVELNTLFLRQNGKHKIIYL